MPYDKIQHQQKEGAHHAHSARKAPEAEKPLEMLRDNSSRFPAMSTASPAGIPITQRNVKFLQRTIGNRAVGRFIQAKLKTGQPGDKYEQEANRVADAVMRMPEPKVQRQSEEEEEEEEIQTKPLAEQNISLIQRQVEEEEEEEPVQTKPLSEQITPMVQRQAEEEEEPLQAKFLSGQMAPVVQRQAEDEEEEELAQPKLETNAENSIPRQEEEEEEEPLQAKQNTDQPAKVTPELASRVQSLRTGGQPLPKSARDFFEPRFGVDLSQVRVHTDSRAAKSTRALNALAYTVGRHVVFGEGQFASGTIEGQRLLAHELVHVVQQSSMSPTVNPVMRQSPPKSLEDDKCKLTICSELPKQGGWGHAFLRISDSKGGTLTRGFWPACAQCIATDRCSFLEKSEILLTSGGDGQVCDDSDERADSEISYDLSRDQCIRIRNFIARREKNPPEWHPLYNCVNFVLEAARFVDIKIPRHFFVRIFEPKELAKFIERKKSRIEGLKIFDSGNLRLVQEAEAQIDLDVKASFRVEPRPTRLDATVYRWIIEDGQGRFYWMWGAGGPVSRFGAHPRTYIPSKTRDLLKQRGIKSATVLCRVKVYYDEKLQRSRYSREQVLLKLPITFIHK